MIQDIAPHKWDITYKNIQPDPDSRVLFFSMGQLLVIENEKTICQCENVKSADLQKEIKGNQINSKNHNSIEQPVTVTISFPRYDDIRHECPDEDFQYLFELDGTTFFRGALSHSRKAHILEVTGGRFVRRNYLRGVQPKELVLAAITGFHLDGWYDRNHFCGRCANMLIPDNRERMLRCPVCGNMVYPRINPAVIVAVTNGDKLLLTKYNGREYKKYALVAGFNEIGESFEETVRREVMEETGLRVKNIRYYKSQPWGFTDNILAGYFCEVDGTDDIKVDTEELSVAKWVPRDQIPASLEELSLTNEMISVFRLDKGK